MALRFIAGGVGIFITFHLIMQATEVVDLLLNFAAIEFVAGLDDIVYSLAYLGLLGDICIGPSIGFKRQPSLV